MEAERKPLLLACHKVKPPDDEKKSLVIGALRTDACALLVEANMSVLAKLDLSLLQSSGPKRPVEASGP